VEGQVHKQGKTKSQTEPLVDGKASEVEGVRDPEADEQKGVKGKIEEGAAGYHRSLR
jgi:hypothetical protein